MIGDIKIIGKRKYLKVNSTGTLRRLPKLKWYQVIYLCVKNYIKGYVHMEEILRFVREKGKYE